MTINELQVDLNGVFEFGQAYVALSRCSSLDGLSVVGFRRGVIFAHPDVVKFYQELSTRDRSSLERSSTQPPKSQPGAPPFLSKSGRTMKQL